MGTPECKECAAPAACPAARRDNNAPSTLTTDRLDRKTDRSTNGLSGPPSDQGLSCHEMAFNKWDPFQSGLRRRRAPYRCASRLHPARFGPTHRRTLEPDIQATRI